MRICHPGQSRRTLPSTRRCALRQECAAFSNAQQRGSGAAGKPDGGYSRPNHTGKKSPAIFPFYHIGVTISAASSSTKEEDSYLNLEAPSIINGCQTITIANEYLKRLERQKDEPALERFREIKVVAKVVVGTTTDELKEITNSNNRQNPIENWQTVLE